MNEKIPYKDESYKIIGICMEIHNTLGNGFAEAVYSEILEKEFIKNNIPYEKEKLLKIFFKGEELSKKYKADYVCYNEIIIELKSATFLHDNFSSQLLNYLKATNKKLGILINFGEKSLKYKRIINL